MEKLFNTKTISANAFGVSLKYQNETSKIIFGGYDKTIVPSFGAFIWFPLVNTDYWSVGITEVFYNGIPLNATEDVGVLDTGTSLVYFNNNTFQPIWADIVSRHADGA